MRPRHPMKERTLASCRPPIPRRLADFEVWMRWQQSQAAHRHYTTAALRRQPDRLAYLMRQLAQRGPQDPVPTGGFPAATVASGRACMVQMPKVNRGTCASSQRGHHILQHLGCARLLGLRNHVDGVVAANCGLIERKPAAKTGTDQLRARQAVT
jgi:hypothetical protein